MNKLLPLALALCATNVAYAQDAEPAVPATPAAPADVAPTAPSTGAPAVNAPAVDGPIIEPAAKALLEESAKAYGALKGLSMQFTAADKMGDKSSSLSGSIAFSRPNKAKLTIKSGNDSSLNLTDGKKIYRQASAQMFQGKAVGAGENAVKSLLQGIPSALTLFLPTLVAGENFLNSPDFPMGSVTLGDDGGVVLRPKLGEGGPDMAFTLTFDPEDKLLRKVEANLEFQGRTSVNTTVLTNIKTNPQFAASEFVFKAAPGVKVVAEVPMYDDKLKVGAAPYALKGKDMQGKAHPWSQYKGKVVLLDFWATWCGPCIGELPNVLSAYKTYHPKGFEIIGVSLDEDKKALTDFIKARKLTYANLFDGKGWKNVDGQSYGVKAIPFTLLIGKDGKIAAVNPRGELLEPAIKKALAVKLPATKAAIAKPAAKPATKPTPAKTAVKK